MDNNAYGESNQGFDNQIIAIPPDSVAQFNVVTNNESAEYGRSSGATINVASASGTNQLPWRALRVPPQHRSQRCRLLQADAGRQHRRRVPFQKPAFNRNQFGMNFGGPILKNKLFFFLDYEGFRQTLKPLYVLHAAHAERDQRHPGCAGQESDHRVSLTRPVRPFLPPPSIRSRRKSSATTSRSPARCRCRASASTGLNQRRLRQGSSLHRQLRQRRPSPGLPAEREYFLVPAHQRPQGDRRQLSHHSAAARRHRPTAPSASSISRLRSAIPICSAPTRCSTRASGSPAPRPANSPSPSARTTSPSPAFRRARGHRRRSAVRSRITSFTTFGRQSTNPQWQNPALLDPKVNFTWVKGKHSLKFGYEYEHIWMAVNDNNPLYGSWTYGGGYSATAAPRSPTTTGPTSSSV